MARNYFVLSNMADFAPGAFENTAVEDGSIQLGRSAGAYIQSGSYTTPAMGMAPFLRCIPSWNADTPKGTAVEVQVRLSTKGVWSRWFGFGKWSPYINSDSANMQDGGVWAKGDTLTAGDEAADAVQLRIYLYSDDAAQTPCVYLLAASTEAQQRGWDEASQTHRTLYIPSYACLVRDPAIASSIATPTALSMMLNRWGEDTLPEEVARAAYDGGAGIYGNLAYAAAIAGAYGYECYVCHGGVEMLRREVRRGNAAAALVRYSAKTVDGQPHTAGAPPVFEGACADSHGHLVVVRGFARRDGGEYLIVNDPLAESDAAVTRELPLARFLEIFGGVCLILHKGPKLAGTAKPERLVGELVVQDDKILLCSHGEEIFPEKLCGGDVPRATVCYTLPDGVAYASAAQKRFYYIQADECGHLHFDPASLAGQRAAFYFIGERGQTWVAEKTFSKPDKPDESDKAGESTSG